MSLLPSANNVLLVTPWQTGFCPFLNDSKQLSVEVRDNGDIRLQLSVQNIWELIKTCFSLLASKLLNTRTVFYSHVVCDELYRVPVKLNCGEFNQDLMKIQTQAILYFAAKGESLFKAYQVSKPCVTIDDLKDEIPKIFSQMTEQKKLPDPKIQQVSRKIFLDSHKNKTKLKNSQTPTMRVEEKKENCRFYVVILGIFVSALPMAFLYCYHEKRNEKMPKNPLFVDNIFEQLLHNHSHF